MENPKKKGLGWLQTLFLLFISFAIIAFFLKDMDWRKVVEASKEANLIIAFLATVVTWVYSWVVFALLSQRTMVWFHGPFPYWDYLWVRGASYLLQTIHPTIRSGSLLLYQKRVANISWKDLAGIKLFLLGGSHWAYAFFLIPATLLFYLLGYQVDLPINTYMLVPILIIIGPYFFFMTLRFFWLGKDHLNLGKLIVRPSHHSFWKPFRESTPRQWFIVFSLTLSMFIVHALATYYRNIAFGVDVPFIFVLATLAWASTVAGLPISYAGFGTTTLAWMMFYGNYGSKEQIVALSLFMPAAGIVIQIVIGLLTFKLGLNAAERAIKIEEDAKLSGPFKQLAESI